MRIYLESLGCRLNYAEIASLSRQLTGEGHVLAATADQADLCVLNSCAVTGDAARKSRQLVRRMAQANPAARLLVTGCYATLEGETVSALPNVALVVGNDRKDRLLDLIDELDDQPPAGNPTPAPAASPGAMPSRLDAATAARTRAFVKVQDGCRNRCTYCIVSTARGEECSRPVAEVVDEINSLCAEGYREIVLTGVHLGAYGRECGEGLRSLVTAILQDTAAPRVRLSSIEPFDLEPDFFDLWAGSGGRLMPHLHLPAQSGSDAVLRRMARRNTAADFEALVLAAREKIAGVTITTDLIAGFPGETGADFDLTVDFAERMRFAHLHVFAYSARAGSTAARFPGQIPKAERRHRSGLLSELDVELGSAVRASFLGDTRPVLWESSTQGGDGDVLWSGLTDNYLRVRTEAPASYDLHNRITAVRLVRLQGPDLWGELV